MKRLALPVLLASGVVVAAGVAVVGGLELVQATNHNEKAAIEREHERLSKQAPLRTKPADPVVERPPAVAEPPFPTGIFETGQAPFSSLELRVENQWQGVIGGLRVHVYAGGLANQPDYGGLRLVMRTAEGTPAGGRKFDLPRGTGSARIAAERNGELVVTTTSGRRFLFNVAAHSLREGN